MIRVVIAFGLLLTFALLALWIAGPNYGWRTYDDKDCVPTSYITGRCH